MLETAHLSVKKPRGSNKDQRQNSTAKWFGLGSNYWNKSVPLCNLSKDNKCLTEDSVTMLKNPTPTTWIQYCVVYQNINTIIWCVQTPVTLWLSERLSSMTPHSKAFGGPLVLIKTITSFSTQRWHQLRASQLAAKQLVFLVVSEVTQFQKSLRRRLGLRRYCNNIHMLLIVQSSHEAACFLLLCPRWCFPCATTFALPVL